MHELAPTEFPVARSLFSRLSHLELTAAAVIDGECPGRMVVDDPGDPRAALLTSPEGSYLAGDSEDRTFVARLRDYVWDELFGRAGWEILFATLDDPRWEVRLTEIASPRDVITVERRHYKCRAPAVDWRALLPAGFEVRQVDAALLDEPDLVVPEHLRGWIANNWGTRGRFLRRGFGVACVHDRSVVSWSLADCRSGDACEIGIQTLPAYRRRGLATVTAAAAVSHALATGFAVVGWHANEDNRASIATAERVGFELDRRYRSLYFYPEEAEELAEKGWIAFRAGRPEETVARYRRVFELRPESPDYQYLLAARAGAATGDLRAALAYLSTAVDRGWSDLDATEACAELVSLHGTPEWRSILERIAGRR